MRAIAALAVLAVVTGCGGATARPALQHELDRLVATHVAPGATAYVAGPNGSWGGASGYANVAERESMRVDARLRLESVSKLWTAVVLVKLADEKKLRLDDTLGRWWPSLFTGAKRQITIRELLNHTSGLVDNNDLVQDSESWFRKTHDTRLRVQLLALAKKLRANPAYVYDDRIEIRWAADLPLLFEPRMNWHYSNIGYKIAGHIAEKASGEPLAALYRRIIIDPLHLKSAAYDPAGPISGEHPVGYMLNGARPVAASDYGEGALGAEGGIVSNAEDEAAFLRAVVQGKLVPTSDLLQTTSVNTTYALGIGTTDAPCSGLTWSHNGGGPAWSSSVAVTADGKRVAVILLNGRNSAHEADASEAALRLLCAA